MYNRYIPQSDGTYRRSRVQENPPRPAIRQPESEISAVSPCPAVEAPACPPKPIPRCPQETRPIHRPKPISKRRETDGNVSSFLKQLLPKNFDTGDLLVVLLLLLMSGDCNEDQNTALITLALYLFL